MNNFQWRRAVQYVPTTSNQQIVASEFGDVTGDGFPDWVYLTGTKEHDSPFLRDITLTIRYGHTNQFQHIALPENAGYNPTIWLGDLTGDGIKDILITIDSGGSGGILYGYVFTAVQGRMIKIFDSIQFNEQHNYTVQYENQYKVSVVSENPKKKYILDLQYKGKEYLEEIYNPDGTLKQPIEGWVDPISGIYPIDLARTGKYYLLTMQLIAGQYHADGLGIVENLLLWDGRQFSIVRQTVSIQGENIL